MGPASSNGSVRRLLNIQAQRMHQHVDADEQWADRQQDRSCGWRGAAWRDSQRPYSHREAEGTQKQPGEQEKRDRGKGHQDVLQEYPPPESHEQKARDLRYYLAQPHPGNLVAVDAGNGHILSSDASDAQPDEQVVLERVATSHSVEVDHAQGFSGYRRIAVLRVEQIPVAAG